MSDESKQQLNTVDDLLKKQWEVEGQTDTPLRYDFVAVAEWPDESRPKIENEYRRKCPIHHEMCKFVTLGNGEEWLIPELEALGKDIHVRTEWVPDPTVKDGWMVMLLRRMIPFLPKKIECKMQMSFQSKYQRHKQLRELTAKVLAMLESGDKNEEGLEINVPWEDAYCIMVLALRVNYILPDEVINNLGLLREEFFWPILSALCGYKKKQTGQELNTPLPQMP